MIAMDKLMSWSEMLVGAVAFYPMKSVMVLIMIVMGKLMNKALMTCVSLNKPAPDYLVFVLMPVIRINLVPKVLFVHQGFVFPPAKA